jgi:hypothetical protein
MVEGVRFFNYFRERMPTGEQPFQTHTAKND